MSLVLDQIRAAVVAAKRNPGTCMLYTGKYWEPAEQVLPGVVTELEKSSKAREALQACYTLLLKLNAADTFEAGMIRDILKEEK